MSVHRPVAIVSAVRTPFGKMNGALAAVHPADLLGTTLRAALSAARVDPGAVGQLINGTVVQRGNSSVNVGRNAWLAAGLPLDIPATTIDTQCGSSLQAVSLAAALVGSGQENIVVASGVETMSQNSLRGSNLYQEDESPYSPSLLDRFDMGIHQGIAGERIATKYSIERDASDEYGMRSHHLAGEAWDSGVFAREIVPLVDKNGAPLLERDEGIRRPDPEKIRALTPVYTPDGVISAASASQLSDGASAVVIASEDAVRSHDLRPLAWITKTAIVGVDPDIMLEGPIEASRRLLAASRLTTDDIDVFEIHEAYATVVLAWLSQFPEVPLEKVNIHGGAIAIGHPFGASGGRQLAHLAHLLDETGFKRGLQAMCCGGGIGVGVILERD